MDDKRLIDINGKPAFQSDEPPDVPIEAGDWALELRSKADRRRASVERLRCRANNRRDAQKRKEKTRQKQKDCTKYTYQGFDAEAGGYKISSGDGGKVYIGDLITNGKIKIGQVVRSLCTNTGKRMIDAMPKGNDILIAKTQVIVKKETPKRGIYILYKYLNIPTNKIEYWLAGFQEEPIKLWEQNNVDITLRDQFSPIEGWTMVTHSLWERIAGYIRSGCIKLNPDGSWVVTILSIAEFAYYELNAANSLIVYCYSNGTVSVKTAIDIYPNPNTLPEYYTPDNQPIGGLFGAGVAVGYNDVADYIYPATNWGFSENENYSINTSSQINPNYFHSHNRPMYLFPGVIYTPPIIPWSPTINFHGGNALRVSVENSIAYAETGVPTNDSDFYNLNAYSIFLNNGSLSKYIALDRGPENESSYVGGLDDMYLGYKSVNASGVLNVFGRELYYTSTFISYISYYGQSQYVVKLNETIDGEFIPKSTDDGKSGWDREYFAGDQYAWANSIYSEGVKQYYTWDFGYTDGPIKLLSSEEYQLTVVKHDLVFPPDNPGRFKLQQAEVFKPTVYPFCKGDINPEYVFFMAVGYLPETS